MRLGLGVSQMCFAFAQGIFDQLKIADISVNPDDFFARRSWNRQL